MNESVRWVTKAEAAEEMEVSLSTLDLKIRTGQLEVLREGRRVYVRMEGPEYLSDGELLHRAIVRESETAAIQSHREIERAYRKERAAHGRTRRWTVRLGVAVVALLVVVGLLAWRLFA